MQIGLLQCWPVNKSNTSLSQWQRKKHDVCLSARDLILIRRIQLRNLVRNKMIERGEGQYRLFDTAL